MTGILNLLLAARGGFTVVQTFTATQDWTVPAGVTSIDYLVVGGGGGGGSGAAGSDVGGGGGASRPHGLVAQKAGPP